LLQHYGVILDFIAHLQILYIDIGFAVQHSAAVQQIR